MLPTYKKAALWLMLSVIVAAAGWLIWTKVQRKPGEVRRSMEAERLLREEFGTEKRKGWVGGLNDYLDDVEGVDEEGMEIVYLIGVSNGKENTMVVNWVGKKELAPELFISTEKETAKVIGEFLGSTDPARKPEKWLPYFHQAFFNLSNEQWTLALQDECRFSLSGKPANVVLYKLPKQTNKRNETGQDWSYKSRIPGAP